MHQCRDGRDGGGSALHIVTPWFDPGRETRAPLQTVSKGWPIVSAASALSSRSPPPQRHTPPSAGHLPCCAGRDPADHNVTLLRPGWAEEGGATGRPGGGRRSGPAGRVKVLQQKYSVVFQCSEVAVVMDQIL